MAGLKDFIPFINQPEKPKAPVQPPSPSPEAVSRFQQRTNDQRFDQRAKLFAMVDTMARNTNISPEEAADAIKTNSTIEQELHYYHSLDPRWRQLGGKWVFDKRPLTDEEKTTHPEVTYDQLVNYFTNIRKEMALAQQPPPPEERSSHIPAEPSSEEVDQKKHYLTTKIKQLADNPQITIQDLMDIMNSDSLVGRMVKNQEVMSPEEVINNFQRFRHNWRRRETRRVHKLYNPRHEEPRHILKYPGVR